MKTRPMHRSSEMLCRHTGLLEEGGSSLIELAIVLPVLLLMLIGAIDLGRECDVALAVSSSAAAGAMYGTFRPTDTLGMQKAALVDANNMTGLVPVAVWGCECSDGSSASLSCTVTPTCTTNYVRYVQVTTTISYTPLFAWPGVASPVVFTGRSQMRAAY